jgi:4-hydroxy-3-methylbut-2-en-1-yl diphosphate reductase
VSGTVLAPLRAEQLALAGAGVPVRRIGMGPARAAAAARALPAGEPVLLAGVAGGLGRQVRPGEVVVADAVLDETGARHAIPSAELLAGALRRIGFTVHIGPIVTVPRLADGADRAALAATGALAVDMESAPVAGILPSGTAFAVLRTIVDTAEHPLWSAGTPARGIAALRALRRARPAVRDWLAAARPAAGAGAREILLAGPRSFCAGVDRAIDVVDRALDRFGAPVYVRRQVVHNAHVVARLAGRGAVFVTEVDEVPPGATVVLAAHGVAPTVRQRATERDLRVVDATCPLVAKVHAEVRRYTGRGDTVLLIGHRDHEEVEGTVGEAPDQVLVVADLAEAARVRPDDPARVAYAMQTTLAVDEASTIADALRQRFPQLQGPGTDDICYATTNRQRAVRAVAREADLVLVVGSANSSNSLRLVEVARTEGVRAYLVDDAGEVDLAALARARRVGITAGASAPPHLVEQVIDCLAGLGPTTRREIQVATEDVTFALPREVS